MRKICIIPNCKNLSCAAGLCQAHLRRKAIYGDVFADILISEKPVLVRKFRPFNNVVVDGERCLKIPLTKGDFTIVDADCDWATNYKWYSMKNKYAVRRENGAAIYLHREIMKCPKHLQVDHINGNGLDNRRKNLRLATVSQNAVNKKKPLGGTSKYRGVSIYSPRGTWQAQIKINGKNNGLGHFSDEKEAAKAYDKAAIKAFGDRAILNF